MKVASRCRIRVLIKVISFRVFSKISLGSSEGQRRQFGAQTMAKLFTSIFVITHIWGSEKICKQQRKLKVFQKKMFSTMQVLTVLRIRTPSLRTSKFELKKKNPTSENKETPCMQQRYSRGLDRLSPLITEHPINYLISQIRGEYNSFPTFCSVNDLR